MLKQLFVVATALLATISSHAELRLPAIINSGMVLQRDQPVRLWGWTKPGQQVTVSFAGKTGQAQADAEGRWSLSMGPFALAKDGRDLTIQADDKRILKDVLVGDVWLASGQSNMAMTARKSIEWKAHASEADDPLLRLFFVSPQKVSPFEPLDDCTGEWASATQATAGNVTAAGYYFARRVRAETGVPIGLIDSSWGGTLAEFWTRREALLSHPSTKPLWERYETACNNFDPATATPKEEVERLMAAFRKAKTEAQRTKGKRPRAPRIVFSPAKKRYAPCNMYNTMIHPLQPYTLAGITWYQGEGNRERAHQYESLLPIMIADWRQSWHNAELPFYVVQLANNGRGPTEAVNDTPWPEQQWAQLQVARTVANSGLAVINDSDDSSLHPRDKKKVGDRLAQLALANLYGKALLPSGPIYREATIEGSSIRIFFDHGDGLTTTNGEPLGHLHVAGSDKVWHPAKARIDGDTLLVSSPSVANPVAARYAWSGNPVSANLTNASGIPASLFKTDNWAGSTHGRLWDEK